PKSPLADSLLDALLAGYEDTFFGEDAIALEVNARDFPDRMRTINSNAEAVCAFLKDHPAIETLYYPKYETAANYDAIRREDGSYGGLFSITLAKGPKHAEAFYNALRVTKGPSLGMNFTMACPFVILA